MVGELTVKNPQLKHQAIANSLEARNVWKLRELAMTSGGLLNDTLRRQAWPLLVRSSGSADDNTGSFVMASGCSSAADRALMEFDVARGTRLGQSTGFSSCNNDISRRSTSSSSARRTRLLHCLQQSIPYSMRYFQGLHHIASVILDTMEEDHDNLEEDLDVTMMEEKKVEDFICLADDSFIVQFRDVPPSLVSDHASTTSLTSSSYCQSAEGASSSSSSPVPVSPPTIQRHIDRSTTPAVECTVEMLHRLALSHLADSMSADDLRPLQIALRLTIVPFLAYFDPDLHDLFWSCGLLDPTDATGADAYSFCLPWILTWFSHDPCLTSATVKRLFDAFVSAHPLLPVYTAVAILLRHGKPFLQEIHDDDANDFCHIHGVLSQLPRQVSDWDAVLNDAVGLMRRLPPRNVVQLAERYYGREQVRINERNGILQMLLCRDQHSSPRVPWFGNEIAKSAAGLGLGDVALRKARRRRKVSAAVLLLLVAVFFAVESWGCWPFRSVRPTDVVPHSTRDFPDDYEPDESSATDGLEAFYGFPADIVLDIEKYEPAAWRATLRPRVIATMFLAIYLRNFLFASSGSVEQLDAHLLQQYQID